MSNQTVAVCSRSFSKNEFLRKALLAKYPTAKFNDQGKTLAGSDLVGFLKGTERAIIALEKLDSAMLEKLPELKLISKYGVGLDNVDFEALQKHDINLSWKGGVNKRAVSELALQFLLLTIRKSMLSNQLVKANQWQQVVGSNLSGKTIGLIGFGFVGQDLAHLLQPFQCKILATDIIDKSKEAKELNVELTTFERVLEQSDCISIHVPLTSKTKNIFNNLSLSKMKSKSILINTARGGIVDETALLQNLKTGHIAAAAFDVFETEPPDFSELIDHPQFFCTSHVGGSSEEAIRAMGLAAIDGLESGLKPIRENFFNYEL